ncbi:hypothetical protein FGO68_gene10551 [Halteria grandinella]|uniref:Uncharacterized protein n=1 Tax=Halteria grandinella TaxID=5974 RepID=A0A8J8NQX5_HALGN|nr:hypothetical protein FGO68_gene10551 [Halteria grandinella]
MAVNTQCLMYADQHHGWQQRVNREIRARARFEHVLADNVSEIERNQGKLEFPSNAFRPLFSPNHVIGKVRNNCRYPTKLTPHQKNYLLIDSSYTVGSDPNTMRDLAIFRGSPLNLHQAVDFSAPPREPLNAVEPSVASDTTSNVESKRGRRFYNKMVNMRRLFNVQLEGRLFSQMKKTQLDFMKSTGNIKPVMESAQKEVFGTRTQAKFEPKKSKAQLTKGKKAYVKVPMKKDQFFIPAAYEIGSQLSSEAPRSVSLSEKDLQSQMSFNQFRPLSSRGSERYAPKDFAPSQTSSYKTLNPSFTMHKKPSLTRAVKEGIASQSALGNIPFTPRQVKRRNSSLSEDLMSFEQPEIDEKFNTIQKPLSTMRKSLEKKRSQVKLRKSLDREDETHDLFKRSAMIENYMLASPRESSKNLIRSSMEYNVNNENNPRVSLTRLQSARKLPAPPSEFGTTTTQESYTQQSHRPSTATHNTYTSRISQERLHELKAGRELRKNLMMSQRSKRGGNTAGNEFYRLYGPQMINDGSNASSLAVLF